MPRTGVTIINSSNKKQNLIINGDMRIAQRGSGAKIPTGSAQYLNCDRFAVWASNVGSMTTPQTYQSSLPALFPNIKDGSERAQRCVATVIGASGQFNIRHRVESAVLKELESNVISLGFWGWASNFQNVNITLYTSDGGKDVWSSDIYLANQIHTVEESGWKYYTIENITLPNRDGVEFVISWYDPSNGAGLADSYITDVMWNEGSFVEPFSLRSLSFAEEFELARRYYYNAAYAYLQSGRVTVHHPSRMIATPIVTTISNGGVVFSTDSITSDRWTFTKDANNNTFEVSFDAEL